MLRRIAMFSLGGLGLTVVVGLCFLLEAHLEMRRVVPALPTRQTILDFGLAEAQAGIGPTSIRYVQSGKQARSGGAHSTTGSFVLGWPQGRLFAIDLGMSKPAMLEFGAFLETVMDAGPIEVFGSLAAQLGIAAVRIEGVAFSHLHTDHAEGAAELCVMNAGRTIPAYQTADQFERQNYTTSSGRDSVQQSGCLDPRKLDADGPLLPIPGFPGLAAFAVGGHTPGSTVFVARVGDRLFLLAGDITNVHSDLIENVPKGFVYSYLMIPEATGRLDELRRWLAEFHAPPDVEVVVSHDLEAIEASGIAVSR